MRITESQIEFYNRNGFLLLSRLFPREEVELMRAEVPRLLEREGPERVLEEDHIKVRSVYGTHNSNPVFSRMIRTPRLLAPAEQLLGAKVYVYQFKINLKCAFGGDVWQWHQDYIFWRNEDGMPSDGAINFAVFLDDVTEFNAPMYIIPGSQAEGVIEPTERVEPNHGDPEWLTDLTARLKYALDKNVVSRLVESYGIVAPKGEAGSVLIFHSNVVHASPVNISPFNRTIAFLTFNRVDNIPAGVERIRPEFLVNRDSTPLLPLH